MNKGLTILSRLKKQYLRLRLTEILLLAIGVMLLIWSTCTVFNSSKPLQAIATIICGIAAFSIRFMQIGLHRTSEKSIVSFLNVKYEEFHASVDLALTSEGNLTTLVRIQQLKTEQKLESLSGQIRFPNHIMLFAIPAIISFTMFLFIHLNGFEVKTKSVSGMPDEKQPDNSFIKNIPAEISEVKVLVSPPAYTRIQQYASTDLNLQVAENSQVSWTLTFSLPIKEASIVTASQDTLKFKFNNNSRKLTATLERNGFYQLVWKDHGTHSSDYYKIEVIKDQPPRIKLSSLNQFTQVTFDSRQSIEANPVISDDYGLTDAYIIATVSKGSGESVKFREEKIRFSTPQQISGKQINSKRTLNLKTLRLEPGDELYFYVEALDNKSPLANRTRTETYFIAIPDTVQDVMTADGGLVST